MITIHIRTFQAPDYDNPFVCGRDWLNGKPEDTHSTHIEVYRKGLRKLGPDEKWCETCKAIEPSVADIRMR